MQVIECRTTNLKSAIGGYGDPQLAATFGAINHNDQGLIFDLCIFLSWARNQERHLNKDDVERGKW